MFTIEEIDPKIFRKKTRKATYIIMAIFAVFGFPLAHLLPIILNRLDINPFILNFSGALLGLFITFWIVKIFFADKDWMKEAIYSWQLKRSLARLYNILTPLKESVENGDKEAMKILRFYHLALERMYQLENNSHANIELIAEKKAHEEKMKALNLDLNQITFDHEKHIDKYKKQAKDAK